MALSVPLSRFTPRVGGGSAFIVRHSYTTQFMEQAIDKTLEIVRTQPDPQRAWSEVISACRDCEPSDLWQALPPVDFERDILAAAQWLSSQLATQPDVSGIYLGLDTLNMKDGSGTNIGFGGSTVCDASQSEQDWIEDNLKFGDAHLIRSLLRLREVYSQPKWEDSYMLADYVLFLGYSGIVLREALIRMTTHRSILVSWGFCEGDNFLLGRKTPERFDLICK